MWVCITTIEKSQGPHLHDVTKTVFESSVVVVRVPRLAPPECVICDKINASQLKNNTTLVKVTEGSRAVTMPGHTLCQHTLRRLSYECLSWFALVVCLHVMLLGDRARGGRGGREKGDLTTARNASTSRISRLSKSRRRQTCACACPTHIFSRLHVQH